MTAAAAKKISARWLTRSVLGIGLASLFCDMSHETITSVLPSFLASMGAAAGALGTIEGFADGLSSIAKLYGGWLADRVHRRKPLCASGYGMMAVAPLIIAAATHWPLVLAGRTFAWLSRGLRTPSRKVLLSEAVAPEAYGRVFGFESALDTIGALCAPLLALVLLHFGMSYRHLIFYSAIPALIAVLSIVLLVSETPEREPERSPFLKSFGGFTLRFKEFLAGVGLFGLGDFARTFYILYAVSVLTPQIGAVRAATWSVGFYALHNVFFAAFSYGGGWAADHVNRRLLLAGGYFAAALPVLAMLLGVHGFVGLALIFAVAGLGVGVFEAVEDTIAAELLPKANRGSGFGALAVVTGTGDWLSSLIVGWLWAGFGPRVAFGYACTLMLAGAAVMLFLSSPKRLRA